MPKPDKIDAAVRACLDRCRRSENPGVTFEKFLTALRDSAAWDETDINLIRSNVLRELIGRDGPIDDHGADEAM
jgi:hypothetical protein